MVVVSSGGVLVLLCLCVQDLSGFDHAGEGAGHGEDAERDEEGGLIEGQGDGRRISRRKGRKGQSRRRELPYEIPEVGGWCLERGGPLAMCSSCR
jgi:hypothetical protein